MSESNNNPIADILIDHARLTEENARLREALTNFMTVMENCNVSTGVCMCGSDMKDHSETSNHSPVDSGHYNAYAAYEAARAAMPKETT